MNTFGFVLIDVYLLVNHGRHFSQTGASVGVSWLVILSWQKIFEHFSHLYRFFSSYTCV